MDNATIARKLNDYATYLEGEDTNVYRVRAYRRAAATVLEQERPLAEVVNEKGRAGLEELPGIGPSLAYTIEGLVRTGEFRTLRPDAATSIRSVCSPVCRASAGSWRVRCTIDSASQRWRKWN